MKTETKIYESPSIEIMDVEVERGFAVSAPILNSSGVIGSWEQGNTSDWVTE